MHILILSLVALIPAGLQEPGLDAGSTPSTEQSVVELTLANGWRFLLVPRGGSPVVAIETAIDVGSVDDGRGQRGLANLFAHLTLQGSERVGSTDWSEERVALSGVDEAHRRWLEALEEGDADETAKAYGAYLEARDRARTFASEESFRRFLEDAGGAPSILIETAPDWTRYAITLPSNQLELWCWLEAERFTRPCLRGFFGERDRWIESRRRDLESGPTATLLDQLRLAALTTHPYRHPVEGYIDDLTKLDKAAAEDFFRQRYGASRLVTTIVGDLRPDTLRPLLERYLATVPANPESVTRRGPEVIEPVPTLGRRIAVSFAAPAEMALAWSTPPFAHTDSAAVEVTARLLGPDPGSRLHRRLVVQDALVVDFDVRAGWPGWRSENLVLVTLTPVAGVDPGRIEAAIDEELMRLRETGPEPAELAALQRSMRMERERELANPEQLARLLNEHHLLTGEWHTAFRRPQSWDLVTPESVQAVADVYFSDVRRTVAVLEPNDRAPRLLPAVPPPGTPAPVEKDAGGAAVRTPDGDPAPDGADQSGEGER